MVMERANDQIQLMRQRQEEEQEVKRLDSKRKIAELEAETVRNKSRQAAAKAVGERIQLERNEKEKDKHEKFQHKHWASKAACIIAQTLLDGKKARCTKGENGKKLDLQYRHGLSIANCDIDLSRDACNIPFFFAKDASIHVNCGKRLTAAHGNQPPTSSANFSAMMGHGKGVSNKHDASVALANFIHECARSPLVLWPFGPLALRSFGPPV